MAKFRKRALQTATYHSNDGQVNVTPERLKHWQENFRRMQKAGYSVPIGWDHAETLDGITPLSADEFKKRSAKDTIGKLSSIALDAKGSGAVLEFDVTDPKAQGRADRNEIFISPVIMDEWRDGAGNKYTDVITHVDFVNHPVDHSQGPFEKADAGAIACALRMGLDTRVYRMAFGDEEDDDDKEKDDSESSGSEAEASADPPENPDMPKTEDDGGKAQMDALLAHLSVIGVGLPADTDGSNFQDRLLVALLTIEAQKNNDKAEEESEPEEEEPAMNVADPGIAAMSLKANAAHSYAEGLHRTGIAKRLQAVLESGQCTPKEHNDRTAALKAVRLSLDAKGQPAQSDLEKWLDSREAVPKGTFWDAKQRTQKLSVTPIHPPSAMTGELSEEETQAAVNFALGRKTKK